MQKYESEGKARKTMPAQDLWFQILTSQVETGKNLYIYIYIYVYMYVFHIRVHIHRP
jgi:hypothetical protein